MDKVNGPRDRVLLRDVARRANVSGSTASRALSDDPRISRATRELVKAAAADLHYVPNAAARSLRARRTRTLGLLLPDLRDPVHGQIASAFEEQARTEGYCVIVVAGERDVLRERLALRIFAEHGTDGVAVVSSVVSPRELRERVDYLTQVLPGILLFSLGLSITVAPLTAAILAGVDQREAGIGSAVNNAVARVAGLIATVAVGALVAAQFSSGKRASGMTLSRSRSKGWAKSR